MVNSGFTKNIRLELNCETTCDRVLFASSEKTLHFRDSSFRNNSAVKANNMLNGITNPRSENILPNLDLNL